PGQGPPSPRRYPLAGIRSCAARIPLALAPPPLGLPQFLPDETRAGPFLPPHAFPRALPAAPCRQTSPAPGRARPSPLRAPKPCRCARLPSSPRGYFAPQPSPTLAAPYRGGTIPSSKPPPPLCLPPPAVLVSACG